jgi:hypothetical protein
VTPEDRQVIYDLVFIPRRGRKGSPEDVLRHFGATDGHALGLRLLRDAADREDGIDADAALGKAARSRGSVQPPPRVRSAALSARSVQVAAP